MKKITEIIIPRPNDFHAHLREKEMLKKVLPFSNVYGYVVAMSNLTKAITTAKDVKKYRKEIWRQNPNFMPIMTVMLTKKTTPDILFEAYGAGARVLKMIPEGVSTNSHDGIDLALIRHYYPILRVAQKLGMVFSGHWELEKHPNGKEIKEIDREREAITYLDWVIKDFPQLKILIEHASTMEMINLVKRAPKNVAATLTIHHAVLTHGLAYNKKGGIKNPFYHCKPIIKLTRDKNIVRMAMISGNPKFFFGSDSAPHRKEKKTNDNPAAGIFTPGEVAVPLLCQIFEDECVMLRLKNFLSVYGANFYGLKPSQETITLIKEKWTVPDNYEGLTPFMAGKKLNWKIKET